MSGINTDINGGGGGGGSADGGGWELCDEIAALGAAQATLTFGSGGDGSVSVALAGNTYEYALFVHIERSTGTTTNYYVEPNGDSANGRSNYASSAGAGSSDASNCRFAVMGAATGCDLWLPLMRWPTTRNATRFAQFWNTFNNNIVYSGIMVYSGTAEITSIVINASAGTDAQKFNTGSCAELWRRSLATATYAS